MAMFGGSCDACCKACRGGCDLRMQFGEVVFVECVNGCRCTLHPCGCYETDPDNNLLPWYHCSANCNEDGELVAFGVCLTAPTEQAEELRPPLEAWVRAVRTWMEEHGYTSTSFDSDRCYQLEEGGGGPGGSQNVMMIAYGCCPEGFDLDGECLNIGDLEPNVDRPYTATVYRNNPAGLPAWLIDIDCNPPTGIIGRVIPPCNPLP